jgi:hypothetical protein
VARSYSYGSCSARTVRSDIGHQDRCRGTAYARPRARVPLVQLLLPLDGSDVLEPIRGEAACGPGTQRRPGRPACPGLRALRSNRTLSGDGAGRRAG